MPWLLKIEKPVYKQLSRIPPDYSRKIVAVIESLADKPYAGDIEKMKGENYVWRRRVGDYRIFYKLFPENKTIRVYEVLRRTSKTY